MPRNSGTQAQITLRHSNLTSDTPTTLLLPPTLYFYYSALREVRMDTPLASLSLTHVHYVSPPTTQYYSVLLNCFCDYR